MLRNDRRLLRESASRRSATTADRAAIPIRLVEVLRAPNRFEAERLKIRVAEARLPKRESTADKIHTSRRRESSREAAVVVLAESSSQAQAMINRDSRAFRQRT